MQIAQILRSFETGESRDAQFRGLFRELEYRDFESSGGNSGDRVGFAVGKNDDVVFYARCGTPRDVGRRYSARLGFWLYEHKPELRTGNSLAKKDGGADQKDERESE